MAVMAAAPCGRFKVASDQPSPISAVVTSRAKNKGFESDSYKNFIDWTLLVQVTEIIEF
jgi:hypothetical protein